MAGKGAIRLIRIEREHYDKEKGRKVRRIFERVSQPPWWENVLQLAIITVAATLIGYVLDRLW